MLESATRLGSGFSPLLSSKALACAFSTMNFDTMEREAAMPWDA
jgi:hypothetical protein